MPPPTESHDRNATDRATHAAVPPPPATRARRSRWHSILAYRLSALGVLLVVVVVAGFFIHLPT
jgi:hypothetical protein